MSHIVLQPPARSKSLQVPRGGEEAAATLRTFGHPPDHAFPIRDHLDLGTHLGLLDFEAGSSVSGTKFVFLTRAAALLELALCSWAMNQVAAKGFMPASTPDLVRSAVLEKCGFQPRGENTQAYSPIGSFHTSTLPHFYAKGPAVTVASAHTLCKRPTATYDFTSAYEAYNHAYCQRIPGIII